MQSRQNYSCVRFGVIQPWIDFFTNETMIHPVTNHPEHKRSFIPSKWEKQKVFNEFVSS